MHLRLHQELLARGAGQEQDGAHGDFLETGSDRRETEPLGGGRASGNGHTLPLYLRLDAFTLSL